MKILVTGAAGFLGVRLINALLADPQDFPRVTAVIAADTSAWPVDDPRVERHVGAILDPEVLRSIGDDDLPSELRCTLKSFVDRNCRN